MAEEMEGSKKWYKSKALWTGVITVLLGLYTGIDEYVAPQAGFDLPTIPEFVFVLLGAMGIYTRATATKTLTK